MGDPINPKGKRVVKKTDIKNSNKKSTQGVETKTVYRKDRVTPKKIVKTEYVNYYTPKGSVMGGSTVLNKQKQKFDRAGKLKSTTTLTPFRTGGSKDEECWPGKPGCGYKKAQRTNKRRSTANKIAPVLKKVGTIAGLVGAGTLGYVKNIGGIKDKIEELKQQKQGGSIKKISKMQFGGDLTKARKCPKGKCGKVSVAPIDNRSETLVSRIRSGAQNLFTKNNKLKASSRRKRIR